MFADLVKYHLKCAGKTQMQLAGYLNISKQGLNNMLSRDNFTERQMVEIMRFFGVELNFGKFFLDISPDVCYCKDTEPKENRNSAE